MSAPDSSRRPRPRSGPLAGIRVADFCWAAVGSLATRLLADFGAEVIKIEHKTRIDVVRRLPFYKGQVLSYGQEQAKPDLNAGGHFNNYCRNKLGVTIDMSKPEGRQLAERLIAKCDVVTENFAPGVMERWGLGPERVREINPEVIFTRMSGFGQSGPDTHYRSYGPVIQAVSGLTHISGLPGREPSGWGLSYMDNHAAYFNAMALLAAIYQKRLTGKGTDTDTSAVEAGVTLLGPVLLDVAVNNRVTRRPDFPTGNRLEYPRVAPHGVYPCAGDDRWIAIAVFSDEEWQAFVAEMGNPAWAVDATFSTMAARHANQDALDQHITDWTKDRDRHDVMTKLQAAGVRAAAVHDAEDVDLRDPQLAERGIFFELDHPVIGAARFEGIPFNAQSFQPDHWRSAPLLSEDNEYVFKTVLGMDDDDYQSMLDRGVISDDLAEVEGAAR